MHFFSWLRLSAFLIVCPLSLEVVSSEALLAARGNMRQYDSKNSSNHSCSVYYSSYRGDLAS